MLTEIEMDQLEAQELLPDPTHLLGLVPDYLYPGEESELAEIGQTRAPACNHISFPNELDEAGFCVNCSEAQQ